jgi:hypothetical protein
MLDEGSCAAQKLAEIIHDNICAVLSQGVVLSNAIDSDHESKFAGAACLHAR